MSLFKKQPSADKRIEKLLRRIEKTGEVTPGQVNAMRKTLEQVKAKGGEEGLEKALKNYSYEDFLDITKAYADYDALQAQVEDFKKSVDKKLKQLDAAADECIKAAAEFEAEENMEP